MGNLGKCLLFYLKYRGEMERLYEAEDPKVEDLADADRIMEKIKLVGDTASQDASDFLQACKPSIEQHLGEIGEVELVRNDLRKAWDLRFRLAPKKMVNSWFEVGVFVSRYRASVIPWVWCQGRRRAEDEIVRILGRGVKASAQSLVFERGTVALAEIEIPHSERLDDQVPVEPLIAKVQQAFTQITVQHVAEIAKIAGSRGEG